MELQAIRTILAKIRGGRLLVGFSGGADSTALLLLAHRFQPELRYHLEAVHFNHRLRGEESEAEARRAAEFAARLGVRFHLIALNLEPGPGVEEAARQARLLWWQQLAAMPETAVALGHHADDRAENLLLRLARGSNVSGLTGLRADGVVDEVRFLRPLLGVSRAEIEEFLRSSGVAQWNVDSSNSENCCRRNWLRNALLPELYSQCSGSREGVQRSLDALEADARFIEDYAERFYAAGDPRDASFWNYAAPALLPRLLRRFVRELSGRDVRFSRGTLMRFAAALKASESQFIPLGDKLALRMDRGRLSLSGPKPPEIRWNWLRGELYWGDWLLTARLAKSLPTPALDEAAFSAEALPKELTVRCYRSGDVMIPFGRTSEAKLKKLRTDRKVPSRPFLPLVAAPEGAVCWAPLVRQSALYPVLPGETVAVLKIASLTDTGAAEP